MKLLSATEDFATRTLGSIDGTLSKLLYVAKLRDVNGQYQHWGLTRVHGEAESQAAVQNAHSKVLSDVLRKPIRELCTEITADYGDEHKKGRLEQVLGSGWKLLLPSGSPQHAESHLKSVLQALAELKRAGKDVSTRPAA